MKQKTIEVKKLNIKLQDKKILEDFSSVFFSNEIVAFFGDNGSGKSSFFNSFFSKKIRNVDELKILGEKIDTRSKRKAIFNSIYYQPHTSTDIFHSNKIDKELLLISSSNDFAENKTFLWKKMKDFGLNNYFNENDSPWSMSGGEKQIFQLFLLYIRKQQIYFLDEPFVFLDEKLKNIALEIILDLKKMNKTIIFSTHKTDLAKKISDRCLYIGDQRIFEYDPKEFYKKSNLKQKQLKAAD